MLLSPSYVFLRSLMFLLSNPTHWNINQQLLPLICKWPGKTESSPVNGIWSRRVLLFHAYALAHVLRWPREHVQEPDRAVNHPDSSQPARLGPTAGPISSPSPLPILGPALMKAIPVHGSEGGTGGGFEGQEGGGRRPQGSDVKLLQCSGPSKTVKSSFISLGLGPALSLEYFRIISF